MYHVPLLILKINKLRSVTQCPTVQNYHFEKKAFKIFERDIDTLAEDEKESL